MDEQSVKREPLVIARGEVVKTQEPVFPLRDGDFLRLTKIHSFIAIWAHSFFAGTGVFLVTLVAKLVDHKYFSASTSVSTLEWITLVILLVLAIIFEIIYWKFPSEKRKTIEKIEEYFKEHG
jgi:H+/Cl- antiporter ClcA